MNKITDCRYADLDVQLYMLAPQHSGIRERSRRRALLEKRNQHLLLGIAEDDLDFEMSLHNIYKPPDEMIAIDKRVLFQVRSHWHRICTFPPHT